MIYCRFFRFWLIFPNQNYKSRSIEFNFNWCWHHALQLKEKTFRILKNLVKTLRTTTKVISCLKILLTSMPVVVRTLSPISRPHQFFPTSPPPDWSFNPLRKLFYNHCRRVLLKFSLSIMKGWKINKQTRAPLLALAKSIYYLVKTKLWHKNYSFYRTLLLFMITTLNLFQILASTILICCIHELDVWRCDICRCQNLGTKITFSWELWCRYIHIHTYTYIHILFVKAGRFVAT